MAPAGEQRPGLSEDLRRLQAEVLAGLEEDESSDAGTSDEKPPKEVYKEEANIEQELTEAALLAATADGLPEPIERAEDVTQLVFRGRGLASLATPRTVELVRLAGSLEVLSLSNNRLQDITPLSALASLLEVNLNFNQIQDLGPLFECDLLEKLFASHNNVRDVVGIEEGCLALSDLSLLANCVEEGESLTRSLQGLPKLRRLNIGQNPCSATPAQRHALVQALPCLEVLDGQRVGALARHLAEGFFAAASASQGEADPDAAVAAATTTSTLVAPARPETAPATGSRPPPLPGKALVEVPFNFLPGQRLRPSRSNRMDDLLTQSREHSPDPVGRGVCLNDKIDARCPLQTLRVLAAHAETLQRRLETLHMERENLKYQVRLLKRDHQEAQLDSLLESAHRLELENRSLPAVESERDQLNMRIAQAEKDLAELQLAGTPGDAASREVPNPGASMVEGESDAVSELRWEGKLLEKRLERAHRVCEQLQQDLLRAQLQSTRGPAGSAAAPPSSSRLRVGGGVVAGGLLLDPEAAADDPEVAQLLEINEAKLRQLRDEVRDTATAMGLRPRGPDARPRGHRSGAVDVLTLGDSGAADVEWHDSAGRASRTENM